MEYRPLGRTGLKISKLSLGGSALGRAVTPADEAEAVRTVHLALDLGINLIDTSPLYGTTRAETVLGMGLRGLRRDRYILATKVGRYGLRDFNFSAERVTRSFDESCARLGVDTIDLLHCHDIEFGDLNQIVEETLPALVKLRQAGKIRFIGITGLPLKIFPAILDRVPAGTVDVILSYCHYNLNDDTLTGIIPRLKAAGVGIIHAAPTGLGMLTEAGPPDWHFAPQRIKDGCKVAVDYCRARGVDIVKMCVQFSTANPDITTTLIGTNQSEEIRRDVAYADAPIDPKLLAEVRATLRPISNHNFSSGGLPENQDAVIA